MGSKFSEMESLEIYLGPLTNDIIIALNNKEKMKAFDWTMSCKENKEYQLERMLERNKYGAEEGELLYHVCIHTSKRVSAKELMFIAKPTYLFLTVIRLFHDGLGHVIQIFVG